MRFSIEIDPDLVERLSVVQAVCLAVAGLLASLVLAAWCLPAIGHVLPSYWDVTKANTAFLLLASTLALALAGPRQSKRGAIISRILFALVLCAALVALSEYALPFTAPFELLLPHNPAIPHPGRMAPFTALNFILLAITGLCLTQRKNLLSAIGDIAVSLLTISVLINYAGWAFGALQLFAVASTNRIGPATLCSLILLTFVAFGRRAEHGVFAIMLGLGLGSRIARMAFPLAAILPFALEALRGAAIRNQLLSPAYASAIATTVAVLLASGLIFLLAWRMLGLEREIVDLSLRDELTTLYNRRGFFLMAEQALWLAQRSSIPFSVLFIDLDGLKKINDTNGHDSGSDFIREAADLLQQVVRKSDIVGRIGGDEFVVAGQASPEDIRRVVDRLRDAIEQLNARPGRVYPFSLSLGFATSSGTRSLQDLLRQADGAMYEAKRQRKLHRA